MPREYQAGRYEVDTFKIRSRYGEVSRKIRGRNGVATGKVRGRYVQGTSKLQTTQPFNLWELMEYEAPKYIYHYYARPPRNAVIDENGNVAQVIILLSLLILIEGILEHLKKIFGVCEVGAGLIAIFAGRTCATAGVITEAPSFYTSTLAVVGGGDLALLGCGLVVDGFRRLTSNTDNNTDNESSINAGYKEKHKIPANDGDGKQHVGKKHNKAIDNKIKDIKKDKNNVNVRKNQKQVDRNGNTVGNNRPDIQYDDKNGVHHDIELDNSPRQSAKHKGNIVQNDPDSQNEFIILK